MSGEVLNKKNYLYETYYVFIRLVYMSLYVLKQHQANSSTRMEEEVRVGQASDEGIR